MTAWLKAAFNFFIFTSLFIAGCALLMVHQANQLLHLNYDIKEYYFFVVFSTICSYNFHWFLSSNMTSETIRVRWTQRHRKLHILLYFIGLFGSFWFFWYFISQWVWLGGAVILTFLYSAPKISVPPFHNLRKVAVGKTLFLAFVWAYVTSFLPIAMDNHHWNWPSVLFCCYRFFLIYSICIPFDYRDREYDKQEGIRSMITHFTEKGINLIFYGSLVLSVVSAIALYYFQFTSIVIICLLIPHLVLVFLYPVSKRNFSDYLYYFVLDGLMMLSSLLTLFISI